MPDLFALLIQDYLIDSHLHLIIFVGQYVRISNHQFMFIKLTLSISQNGHRYDPIINHDWTVLNMLIYEADEFCEICYFLFKGLSRGIGIWVVIEQ